MTKGVFIAVEASRPALAKMHAEVLSNRLTAESRVVKCFVLPDPKTPEGIFSSKESRGAYAKIRLKASIYGRALFYAIERYELGLTINELLKLGTTVIVTGWRGQTMAELGMELPSSQARRGFFLWLEEFERQHLPAPQPEISFLLANSNQNVKRKINQEQLKGYIQGEIATLLPKDYVLVDVGQEGNAANFSSTQRLLHLRLTQYLHQYETPNKKLAEDDQGISDAISLLLESRQEFLALCKKSLKGVPDLKAQDSLAELGYLSLPLGSIYTRRLLWPDGNKFKDSKELTKATHSATLSPASIQLLWFWPLNEFDALSEPLFDYYKAPSSKLSSQVKRYSYDQKLAIYNRMLKSSKPGGYNWPKYELECQSTVGLLANILSSTMRSAVNYQDISVGSNYFDPPIITKLGLEQAYLKHLKLSLKLQKEILGKFPAETWKLVLCGKLVRWKLQINPWQIKELGQLIKNLPDSSNPTTKLIELIAEKHPVTGQWLES